EHSMRFSLSAGTSSSGLEAAKSTFTIPLRLRIPRASMGRLINCLTANLLTDRR
ncbi:hypothetical protein LPJ66_006313, partial [Kickxella alabastrina]